MNKRAMQAVVRARTVLLVSNPFYGTLALRLKVSEIEDPVQAKRIWGSKPTMAVDGVNLIYDAEFILAQKEDELVGIVAHEVSHCAYQHFARRGPRNPRKWNIATDYVINDDLRQAGFALPKWVLHDVQYRGMSAEEIYGKLPDPPPNQGGGGGGENGGSGDDCLDPGGCGGVLDAPMTKEQQAGLATDWEGTVRIAAAVAAASNAGKLPGHLERLVGELKKPRVNWRDMTRRFIDNSMMKDFSWARPNRRAASTGLILPGYIPDRLHHLVGVIDTSGSITKEMLTEFVSEMAGALDEGVADRLTLVYADDGVRHVDEYQCGDLVDTKAGKGGGGTDFTGSFKWIKENTPDASCVVYLTDLCTSGYGEEPDCPVMWATFIGESQYPEVAGRVPFGEPILVNAHPY